MFYVYFYVCRKILKVIAAEKLATSAKTGETCSQCSPGKICSQCKRGKICNQYQARKNMQPLPSAGKFVVSAKRGKICNQYQARKVYSKCHLSVRHVLLLLLHLFAFVVAFAFSICWRTSYYVLSSFVRKSRKITATFLPQHLNCP